LYNIGVLAVVKPGDSTRLTEAKDRLIDLLVQHDEANRAKDWQLVSVLEPQIGAARAHRDELRESGTAEGWDSE
jgi:hypothetical protein